MTSIRVAHETARLRLSRYRIEGQEGRLRAAMHATEVSAAALAVGRVGIWVLDGAKKSLSCLIHYDGTSGQHAQGEPLDVSSCPAYLGALGERRVLVVTDVRAHPATQELGPLDLIPRGVGALLDAPILREGELLGVVRHEHLGSPREWKQKDVDFASSVADMVALIFEQAARLELETALHDHAEQRQESQKMEALGRMASAIAHDFNNVLGAAYMTTEADLFAQGDMTGTGERLRRIIETGQRLTARLLAFAQERTGAPVACDLVKVLETMLPMLRTATGSRATLTLEVSAADAVVALDRSQLEQLLLNLVLNSRDAISQSGTIQIVVRDAVPEDAAPPSTVVVSVIDDGAGMDEATRRRVFEPFFTTKEQGTGLGLATVFGIVRRADGTARVASEPGAGTTVSLLFPRYDPG